MNRRIFLKLLGFSPIVPSVLMAKEKPFVGPLASFYKQYGRSPIADTLPEIKIQNGQVFEAPEVKRLNEKTLVGKTFYIDDNYGSDFNDGSCWHKALTYKGYEKLILQHSSVRNCCFYFGN